MKATEILPKVKLSLRLSGSDHDVFLLSLILEGARRLRTTETFIIDDCSLTVQNNSFELPCNAKRLLAYRLSCREGIFVDVPFFKGCCSGNYFNYYPTVKQNGSTYYFVDPVTDGSTVDIAYTRLNTDGDGLIVINEEQEIALKNYACWQFALSYPEKYTPLQIRTWEKDYQYQSAYCRGAAARRTFENQREQISSKMNAILTVKNPVFRGLFSGFYYPVS